MCRKTYDEFKQLSTILEENEVAVIDTGNDRKVTVIGDGKTPAIDCRRIDFPYTEIVAERDYEKGRYICRFINSARTPATLVVSSPKMCLKGISNMVQLYNGDCLELMKTIPDKSIDCILCDLPYGTTSCSWDVIIPFNKLWEQYKRITKDNAAIILFGQEPFSSLLRCSNLSDYRYDIYWEKERLTNINQVKRRVGKTVETISIFYRKQCTYNPQMIKYDGPLRSNKVKDGVLGKLTDSNTKRVFEYHDTGYRYPTQVWKFQRDCLKSNLHPTQKPIALLEELIKTYTNEGDLVLDNCMGSGSTGVACVNTNRNFIGIELDESYFEIAKNRISEVK